MKTIPTLSIALLLLSAAPDLPAARTQPATTAPTRKTAPVQPPASKPVTTPPRKVEAPAPATQEAPPDATAAELIAQGKSLYRTLRFKQALAKFEAALKLEPEHDEALGLAAVTAFRLDNQTQSREYFLRRAELPNQKESVKAFSFYRVALTYWRDCHDLVAKYGELKEGRVVYTIPEHEANSVSYAIENGLEYAEKALAITGNFAEAHNVKNLLHAEAANVASDEAKAQEQRTLSLDCLRRAIELAKSRAGRNASETADFSLPTVRLSEFARSADEDALLQDEVMKLIQGGKPVRRVPAVFPALKPPKPGETQTEPAAPGKVKVEVLISTAGEVVFARVVEGRSDVNGAAIVAARSWKFEPAKFEGAPVQVSGVITFELKPGRARPAPTPTPKPTPASKP